MGAKRTKKPPARLITETDSPPSNITNPKTSRKKNKAAKIASDVDTPEVSKTAEKGAKSPGTRVRWKPEYEVWVLTKRLQYSDRFTGNEAASDVWNEIYEELANLPFSPIPPSIVVDLTGAKLSEKCRTLKAAVALYYQSCK